MLDATTGQNGLVQARQFTEAVEVTGVVLTKLDGSAKGGIVFAIQSQLGIPVKLVGLGESADDLVAFDADEFVDALFVLTTPERCSRRPAAASCLVNCSVVSCVLPLKLVLAAVGTGFRVGRLVGPGPVRRRAAHVATARRCGGVVGLLVGLALGLLFAPVPGRELRASSRRGRSALGRGHDAELAEQVGFELEHAPAPGTCPQPDVDVATGRVVLSGLGHEAAATSWPGSPRPVPGRGRGREPGGGRAAAPNRPTDAGGEPALTAAQLELR